jgi:hypothetical protein
MNEEELERKELEAQKRIQLVESLKREIYEIEHMAYNI